MNGKLKITLAAVFIIIASFSAYFIVAQNAPAPDVVLSTYQGEKFPLAQWRGKVVLVNFWATSCTTCIKEMPELAATHKKYAAQGLETVAVAMNYDNPGFVTAFALKNALPFAVAYDADGSVAQAFGGIRLTPTTFIIDRQGKIVKRILGEPNFSELHAQLEALLK